MKIIDLHNHSRYSYDGQSSISELVENAIENGVTHIGITDHQFSIGELIGEYIDAVLYAKEKYKNQIQVLCGLEIGTRPRPQDFPAKLSERLDFCLFESLDDEKGMDIYEFFEWKRRFRCPIGLAHTDIFKLSERYGMDVLKVLKHDDVFWEINFSGNYSYYYDFITNDDKRRLISQSGIKISVGSDLHWVGDFDRKRLIQANELAMRLKNPLALGISD